MQNILVCPVCGKNLFLREKTFYCENSHSYDVSRNGYVNLLLSGDKNSLSPGDNKEMAFSRDRFLSGGFYDKISNYIGETVKKYSPEILIDACASEGYYTHKIKSYIPYADCYAFDLSKSAVKLGASKYKDVNFFVASAYKLPVKSESVDTVLRIFAPLAENEYLRVLKKGGLFISVTPAENHLKELKKILYENVRKNIEKSAYFNGLKKIEQKKIEYSFELKGEEIYDLFTMTPYFYTTQIKDKEKLKNVNTLTITAAVIIETFIKE